MNSMLVAFLVQQGATCSSSLWKWFIDRCWTHRYLGDERLMHDVTVLTRLLTRACDFIDYAETRDLEGLEPLLNLLVPLSNSAPEFVLLQHSEMRFDLLTLSGVSTALCSVHLSGDDFITSDWICFERLVRRIFANRGCSTHSLACDMLWDTVMFLYPFTLREGIGSGTANAMFIVISSRIGILIRLGADPCAINQIDHLTLTLYMFNLSFSDEDGGKTAAAALGVWFKSLAVVGIDVNAVALRTFRLVQGWDLLDHMNSWRHFYSPICDGKINLHAFKSMDDVEVVLWTAYWRCGMIHPDDSWFVDPSLAITSDNASASSTDFVPSTMHNSTRNIPVSRRSRAFDAD